MTLTETQAYLLLSYTSFLVRKNRAWFDSEKMLRYLIPGSPSRPSQSKSPQLPGLQPQTLHFIEAPRPGAFQAGQCLAS